MMIACQHCGHAVSDDAKRCPGCGGRPYNKFNPITGFIIFLFAGAAYIFNYFPDEEWLILYFAIGLTIVCYGLSRYYLKRQRDELKGPKSTPDRLPIHGSSLAVFASSLKSEDFRYVGYFLLAAMATIAVMAMIPANFYADSPAPAPHAPIQNVQLMEPFTKPLKNPIGEAAEGLLKSLGNGVPTIIDACGVMATAIAEELGLDNVELFGDSGPLQTVVMGVRGSWNSLIGDEFHSYTLNLSCHDDETQRLILHVFTPHPSNDWYKFISRAGAILTHATLTGVNNGIRRCVNATAPNDMSAFAASTYGIICEVDRDGTVEIIINQGELPNADERYFRQRGRLIKQ